VRIEIVEDGVYTEEYPQYQCNILLGVKDETLTPVVKTDRERFIKGSIHEVNSVFSGNGMYSSISFVSDGCMWLVNKDNFRIIE